MEDIMSNNNSDNTTQYGQPEQPSQYGQAPDPQRDMSPTVTPPKKISKASVITVIVLLLIFALAAITLAPSYAQARKFGKAIVNGSNKDDIGEMMFPKEMVKNGGDVYDLYEKMILQKMTEEIQKEGNASFLGVKPGKSIKKSDFRYFEKYYKFFYQFAGLESNVKIQKGYEYKIKFKAGGKKYYTECSVIKIKGEGWKVVPGSVKDVKETLLSLGM